jgi:response regulator NasT
MPVLDGLEALSQINEQKLYPVIILTAFSQKDLIEKAVKLGAKAYVVKPFRSTVLKPAIQLALAHFNELKVLQEENATLKEVIELSKLINKAKGLLMEHEKLPEQEAFRKIQKISMDRNKKMKEVAEAVILIYEKSTIPDRPS